MNWLRRIGLSQTPDAPAETEPEPERVEGAAPGVAAILGAVDEDRSHAILDLGPASDPSLRVYSRFARWIRFADLFGEAWAPRPGVSPVGLLKTVLPPSARAYDIVFAWDILDRLFPDHRPHLTEWLADITAPDTRVHVIVRSSEVVMQPLRFAVLDVDRIRYEPTSSARLPPSRLMPADVAKVLAPLHVVHAFTLKTGFREYVAVRR